MTSDLTCCFEIIIHPTPAPQGQNHHNGGLVHERRNSSALAMELGLSCIIPIDIVYQICQPWGYQGSLLFGSISVGQSSDLFGM